ncbi:MULTISPECIES: acyl carrier protein [unclassified Streptomyces]|uniref:acyl carrier protein n=1 Tax=unclassified Streptomyces TaxID=2593676 RepID=UPI00278C4767|nr:MULTISPECIES: acyl carrier protein [unclassified Streptomyces]
MSTPTTTPAAIKQTERRLRTFMTTRVAELLKVAPDEVSQDAVFRDLGLSSVQVVELAAELEDFSGRQIPATMVYEYPTIADAAAYVARQ